MQHIISAAATEIQNLAGQPLDIILGAVDGVGQVTVPELAQLIDDLLTNVVGCLGDLEATLGPKIDTLIDDVLCDAMYVAFSFASYTILIVTSIILQ
jgi:hypothetical protein